ncbi:hypothetical protein [Xanthobacter agilis]|uniref:Flagellar protein FlgN n=1 Tax=Xanthobacter agilis TaxID=47492 RepID=A0ABU0LHS0_XANAG|nr:hypothetical protein [Xanthobacter agilis]MDQ0506691.1 hypothetical protein [Xanthobacter agilis]
MSAPSSVASGAVVTPAVATLLSAIDHLEEALDAETTAFETRTPFDIEEINRRKSRCLLELSRAARALPQIADADLVARVGVLKAKLERNSYVLSVQLAAAQEVAAILDRAMRESESDGTYSAMAGRGEKWG